MKSRILVGACFTFSAVVALTSCASGGSELGDPPLRSAAPSGRGDQARNLPFDTNFPNRWNSANDGSAYEPCNALRVDLVELGIDPDSVSDAAGTDGQTARGCEWRYLDDSPVAHWTVSQVVGNSSGLAREKARVSGNADVWLPDLRIGGRTVGVHFVKAGGDCDTYVQSGKAAVSTIVVTLDTDVPVSEICDRAIAFTSATIDKIPH